MPSTMGGAVEDPQALTAFLKANAGLEKADFLARHPGGFLLGRFRNAPPFVVPLAAAEGFTVTVGSDDECEVSLELDQTLDANHARVSWHKGFNGWTVEDLGSSFGTAVDGERVAQGRALLLRDKQVIRLGGGLSELQFYAGGTLWERMRKAGVTKSLKKVRPQAEAPAAAAEPDADGEAAPGALSDSDVAALGDELGEG